MLAALGGEGGLIAQARVASEALEGATQAVEAAEHELDLFVANPKLLSALGEQRFLDGVEARQQALEEARAQLAEIGSQTAIVEELTDGDLLGAWPALTTPEKRTLLHGFLDRVVLRRAGARGRAAPPIEARTQIVMRGNVLLGANPDQDLPG